MRKPFASSIFYILRTGLKMRKFLIIMLLPLASSVADSKEIEQHFACKIMDPVTRNVNGDVISIDIYPERHEMMVYPRDELTQNTDNSVLYTGKYTEITSNILTWKNYNTVGRRTINIDFRFDQDSKEFTQTVTSITFDSNGVGAKVMRTGLYKCVDDTGVVPSAPK